MALNSRNFSTLQHVGISSAWFTLSVPGDISADTKCIYQNNHIHLSKPNTNWGKQRLLYHACKEYNDLDNNIKSIKELDSFYNALHKFPKY